jgi:hypothetical protein
MMKVDDALLGIGSIAFAMSGVWAYTVDAVLKDETDIQSYLLGKEKYKDNSDAAGERAKTLKKLQRIPFFALWIAGLILSILAIT